MSGTIVLIRPPSVLSRGRVGSVSAAPPLGVAYLAAVLRTEGYAVTVVDAFGESPTRVTSFPDFDLLGLTNEEIVARLPAEAALFGFSCMFSNEWIYLKQLIALVKKRCPGAVTLLGGEHASALPAYSLESCPELDYVIGGEGETPLVRFVRALFEQPEDLRRVEGLFWRDAGRIRSNPRSARIRNVNDLPFPAWDLVPVENYLREGIATITRQGQRIMPMLASRGCPYACKFCSNPAMYGVNYFIRDVENVLQEVRWLRERYDVTGFELHDLTFIIRKPWIKQFCRRLIEEDLRLEWNVPTTRSEAIDEEVVELLRRSGCKNLCLTPDSGSPRMIKEMLKNVDLEKITRTARTILAAGIVLKVNIVFGFPGERHRDVWQSIRYGLRLASYGIGSVLFYRFTPYPGSAYFDLLLKRGVLPPFGPEFDRFLVTNIYNELSAMASYSEHISNRAIRAYLFLGYALCQLTFFLRHPGEIVRTAKRLFRKTPESQADLLIMEVFRRFRFRLLSW